MHMHVASDTEKLAILYCHVLTISLSRNWIHFHHIQWHLAIVLKTISYSYVNFVHKLINKGKHQIHGIHILSSKFGKAQLPSYSA